MGIIFEVIFSILWEFVFQLFFQILLELGYTSIRPRRAPHPVLSGVSCVVLGAAAGGLMLLVFPERIIADPPLPGASLLLAPLLSGLAMHLFGEWRHSGGYSTSFVASFWGGALFALAAAVIRFAFV